MEKKQNRSVLAQTKGVGTEKNQDVANSKCFPRGSRKREPSSGVLPPRKPIPQKSKSLDKRPKPRGLGSGPQYPSGDKGAGVTDRDAELGSVFVPGSKKQSLNHLLNFHYTPREVHTSGAGRVNRNKHRYNKEQFLQANCQFVVNSDGDYKLYMNNPDALVDWDMVEQIHVQVTEFPSCPICLYPPVAAKMTRCGHVYCWSCILHYLALSDKPWRKCPICYEAIDKQDLKSAIAIPHSAFNVNEYLTLRLMKRAQGSLTAVPVDEAKISRNVLLNMSETKVNTVYSKLLLANNSEVMSIIDRERSELNAQLIEDENCPEKCFIDQALNQLIDREKIVFEKLSKNQPKVSTFSESSDGMNDLYFDNNLSMTRTRFESSCSEVESEDLNHSVVEDLEANNDNNIDNNVKHYYFYQASDGQHIYLHALNIRMLEHTYGSLDQCPTTIRGRILEKEGGSMTEDLRKRLRYLQHLPVTCQFEVAEIQMKTPIVNKETMEMFQEQIETRKKRRNRRQRDEKRREKRILEEENRRLGKLPEVNMHIESLHAFPQFCGGDDPPLESPVGSLGSFGSERSPIESLASGGLPMEENNGPSFAKMLATGKSKPPSWPQLSSSTPSVPKLINISRSSTAPVIRNRKPGNQSDSEPEPDGYVPIRSYNQSFSDVIAMALEKASIQKEDGESSSNGKKKKKKKQKVLFATSMVYSGK